MYLMNNGSLYFCELFAVWDSFNISLDGISRWRENGDGTTYVYSYFIHVLMSDRRSVKIFETSHLQPLQVRLCNLSYM